MSAASRAGAANKKFLATHLKTVMKQAASGAGASHCFLVIRDPITSEIHHVGLDGKQQVPDGVVTAARLVMSTKRHLFCEEVSAGCSMATQPVLPGMYVPVMSGKTCRGVLAVGALRADRGDLSHRLQVLEPLAGLCAALMENQDLQMELRRKEEQVRDLVRDTLDAHESERERICLEIHDGVAQVLASAFQYLQLLEPAIAEDAQARKLLLKATALVKQAIQETREVINSLQPATLMYLGLVATLQQELKQLEQETGWKVEFDADNIRLPRNVEIGLYRIIHEAITNAKRHAHTKRLRIGITTADDQLHIEVQDWGVGFYRPPVDRRSLMKRRGIGLLSMSKRAELLRGHCDIESSPGQGTTVQVEIPLSG